MADHPTAEQLRKAVTRVRARAKDEAIMAKMQVEGGDPLMAADYFADANALTSAADALEEKAARMERPWLYCVACQARRAMEAKHAEPQGWGVMRPDGTLWYTFFTGREAQERAEQFAAVSTGDRAIPVRLTTEGATAQEGESNG